MKKLLIIVVLFATLISQVEAGLSRTEHGKGESCNNYNTFCNEPLQCINMVCQ